MRNAGFQVQPGPADQNLGGGGSDPGTGCDKSRAPGTSHGHSTVRTRASAVSLLGWGFTISVLQISKGGYETWSGLPTKFFLTR